jgi:methionyl-tRNA formyltransferase
MTETYVIASTRPWNSSLADKLRQLTGKVFLQVTDPDCITREYLAMINPRVVFFPHWSLRIPADVLQQFECVIFHMTDLPFGRGGSPLQNLIARGIYETKISALKCVEEMDAGPVYLKRPLALHGAAEEIYLRASRVIEGMMAEIVMTQPQPVDQVGAPVVFKRRKPEQGNLAQAQSLETAFDLIRMLDADGYPHAFLTVGGMRLEFARARLGHGSLTADVTISMTNQPLEDNQ